MVLIYGYLRNECAVIFLICNYWSYFFAEKSLVINTSQTYLRIIFFTSVRLETLVCIGLHVKAKPSRWLQLSLPEPMSKFKIRLYIGMRSFSREPVLYPVLYCFSVCLLPTIIMMRTSEFIWASVHLYGFSQQEGFFIYLGRIYFILLIISAIYRFSRERSINLQLKAALTILLLMILLILTYVFNKFRLETLACMMLHLMVIQSRWWRLSPPEPISTLKMRFYKDEISSAA